MFFKKKTEPPKVPQDEQSLLELYLQTGKSLYIGELYKKFTPMVYGVCMKYLGNTEDSQDAVMQIFEKLLTDFPRQEIKNLAGWLYIVTKNHCLMLLRSRRPPTAEWASEKLENRMELSEEIHLPDEVHELALKKLQLSLPQLPVEQRRCIELFFYEQKSYKEIVGLTGYDLTKVKSYLQNGKRMLKILMEKP